MSRLLIWALTGVFLLSGPALAQDGGSQSVEAAFPANVVYAAILAIWLALTGAIVHLWNKSNKLVEDHAAAMEAMRVAHAAAMAEKDKELREIQDARRVESGQLLREQKDIFAEVMVTTAKMGTAFDENRGATMRLQELVEGLSDLIESQQEE